MERKRVGRFGSWCSAAFVMLIAISIAGSAQAADWRAQWPKTDFGNATIKLSDVLHGGPPKDGIPSIDNPRFVSVSASSELTDLDPVVSLELEGEARAYPLRVLTWHEIVNDRLAGRPIAVTYCPLCNAAIAFDGRLDGREFTFGVSGMLRHSDMIMYDRQTESWWQQYSGEAIVGELAGRKLRMIPVRLESFARFRDRHPNGQVLVPNDPSSRPYGANPYIGYEDSGWPFLYRGEPLKGITALERVIVVGKDAWTLDLLKVRKRVEQGDLVLEWIPGQASALDQPEIAKGRDVGNVLVRRNISGELRDEVHHVTFAFVYFAFQPDGRLQGLSGPISQD